MAVVAAEAEVIAISCGALAKTRTRLAKVGRVTAAASARNAEAAIARVAPGTKNANVAMAVVSTASTRASTYAATPTFFALSDAARWSPVPRTTRLSVGVSVGGSAADQGQRHECLRIGSDDPFDGAAESDVGRICAVGQGYERFHDGRSRSRKRPCGPRAQVSLCSSSMCPQGSAQKETPPKKGGVACRWCWACEM